MQFALGLASFLVQVCEEFSLEKSELRLAANAKTRMLICAGCDVNNVCARACVFTFPRLLWGAGRAAFMSIAMHRQVRN